jgi:hypothetical protein
MLFYINTKSCSANSGKREQRCVNVRGDGASMVGETVRHAGYFAGRIKLFSETNAL